MISAGWVSKISSIIDDPPVSIRPIDTCDPLSLQSNKEVNNGIIQMHVFILMFFHSLVDQLSYVG